MTDKSYNERNQIYLQSKLSIESAHRISKPRRNPNSNLNNLVISCCHKSCSFWRIGLNDYQLLLLETSKSGFAEREGKDGLLMHTLIAATFSLFFFFLCVLFFNSQFLITILPWVVFLIWVFSLFLGSSLWVFTTLLPWISFLRCFSPPVPLSSMASSSFYSELIQWNFSLLPLGLHQLFLVCCGHPFKITH